MFIPKFTNTVEIFVGIIIGLIAALAMYGITVLDKKIDETKEKNGEVQA